MSKEIIYREDAITEIRKAGTSDVTSHHYAELFINAVRRALPADRPQGEWIIEQDGQGHTYGKCSVCGMKQYAGYLNFCPDCGSRMKGAE